MSTDLLKLSAVDLLQLYRTKRLSPVEVTRAVLQHIDTLNPVLNAFCFVAPDAMAMAERSEARWVAGEPKGPLDGVPVSIKDILLTRGWPTLRGSKTVDPAGPWNDDAPAVARLRESGAVLLGKNTTPEFGWKGVTDSPLTGITRNPWNLQRRPGGSSGGGAAAVAAGMGRCRSARMGAARFASRARSPAFRPEALVRPRAGVAAVAVRHGGARRADDALRARRRAAAERGRAARLCAIGSRCPPMRAIIATAWTTACGDGASGIHRISAMPTWIPKWRRWCEQAAMRFVDLGAQVDEVNPGFAGADEIFRRHWHSGAAYLLRNFTPQQKGLMDPGLVEVAEQGAQIRMLELLDAVQKRGALGTR